MKLLYFAWVRQKIGRSEETIDAPPTVATVGDLDRHLCAHAAAAMPRRSRDLNGCARLSIRNMSRSMRRSTTDDEIAFFPPVTGG